MNDSTGSKLLLWRVIAWLQACTNTQDQCSGVFAWSLSMVDHTGRKLVLWRVLACFFSRINTNADINLLLWRVFAWFRAWINTQAKRSVFACF
jgi:hypothetical protein